MISHSLPLGFFSSLADGSIFSHPNDSVDSLDKREADISEGTISKSSQAKSYFEERYKQGKGGEKVKDGRKSYRLTPEESKKLAESLEHDGKRSSRFINAMYVR